MSRGEEQLGIETGGINGMGWAGVDERSGAGPYQFSVQREFCGRVEQLTSDSSLSLQWVAVGNVTATGQTGR